MGIHYYDSTTDSSDTMKSRLQPALSISRKGIPCIVWAEDALSFVHFVPTSLFTLQLIIPDESLEAAAQEVVTSLPYRRMLTPIERWSEFSFVNPSTPNCFPNSVALELCSPEGERSADDPKDVLLHPQSYFHGTAFGDDSTVQLDGFPSNIRFPTRPTFLNVLIATILDPPLGYRNQRLHLALRTYLSYVMTYTLRNQPRVQPDGLLEPEHALVVSSLEKENRPFFDKYARNINMNWIDDVKERRLVLERLGPSPRPLPRDLCIPARNAAQVRQSLTRGTARSFSSMPYEAAMSRLSYIRRLFRKG